MKDEDLNFDINISNAPPKEDSSLKNRSSMDKDIEVNEASSKKNQTQKTEQAIKESITSISSNEGINVSNFLKHAHNPGIVFSQFFQRFSYFFYFYF